MKTFEVKTLVTVEDDIDEWVPAIKAYYLEGLADGADHTSFDFAKSLFVRMGIDGLGFWLNMAHPYLGSVIKLFTLELVEKPEGATGWYAPHTDADISDIAPEEAHKLAVGDSDIPEPTLDMEEFEAFLAAQRERNHDC